METLTCDQATTRFGDLLIKVQRNPIQISRNGEPVAVMLSMEDYNALEAMKLQLLQQKVQRAEDDLAGGKIHKGDVFLKSLIEGDDI